MKIQTPIFQNTNSKSISDTTESDNRTDLCTILILSIKKDILQNKMSSPYDFKFTRLGCRYTSQKF